MLKITVITVCYNAKNKLRETMDSVCRQTYPDVEYLIVDGGSADGTLSLLQDYALKYRNISFCSEKDFGIYNAMNRGIARASGDYVLFMNAGDLLYNEYVIEEMVSYMEGGAGEIYYGKACRVCEDGLRQIQDFLRQDETLEEKLLQGGMPCHQTIFAPRCLLVDHYFRERYRIRADYEWLMYSVSNGNKCLGTPVVVCYYDVSGTSSRIENRALLWQEGQEIIDEYRKYFAQDRFVERRKEKESVWKVAEQKYAHLFRLMSCWMAMVQKGIRVGAYLQGKGYRHIAVYGMGSMGLRLADELEGYGIEIKYAIDRNAENLRSELRVVMPDESLEEADVMIVTAVTDYHEIRGQLQEKISFPIVSLEDIIYEAADGYAGL